MALVRTRGGLDSATAELPSPRSRDEGDDKTRRHFAIGNHHFVAIPEEEWSLVRCSDKGSEKLRAAGSVELDGVRHVLIEQRGFEGTPETGPSISTLLTSRELQIAYSVADGKGDKVIAHDLGISEYTVREHMRRIFCKLKVSKRAALVAQLIKARFDHRFGRD